MIPRLSKAEEVELIVQRAGEEVEETLAVERVGRVVHTLRAVIVVIDLTKSINMKDFKPSRLSVVISMLKLFFKRAKENTPIIKFALAIVENETCKFRAHFTYDLDVLCQELDLLKVSADSGHFSMENTLRSCLYEFESVIGEFHKEILVVQSSPLTKDVRNIFETIEVLKTSRIAINIVSMVGWTNVYLVLPFLRRNSSRPWAGST
jgi:transcription initiation factor TFIIH subunit 2